MQAVERDSTLTLNSALQANIIAEAAGIVNENMSRWQRLEAMYAHGLRFTPTWLLSDDHPVQGEEAEFFVGSSLTEDQIARKLKEIPKDKRINLSILGESPKNAVYYKDPASDGKYLFRAGELLVGKEIKYKAVKGLEYVAAGQFKSSDKPTPFNGLLAKRMLKAITAQTDEPEIVVRRLSKREKIVA